MSLIEKNEFQIIRGGVPGNYQGCVDLVFESAATDLEPGYIVELDTSNGKYKKAATISTAHTAPLTIQYYMVLNAHDDYDTEFTGKYVGLRGSFRVKMPVANVVVDTDSVPAVGKRATIKTAGKLTFQASEDLGFLGIVVEYVANSHIILDMKF